MVPGAYERRLEPFPGVKIIIITLTRVKAANLPQLFFFFFFFFPWFHPELVEAGYWSIHTSLPPKNSVRLSDQSKNQKAPEAYVNELVLGLDNQTAERTQTSGHAVVDGDRHGIGHTAGSI